MKGSRLLGRAVRNACSVHLMALDAAARGLYVTQYIEYDGRLPLKALQAGLNRALDQHPVLQGWLEQNKTDGSVLLRWGSNSSNSNDSSTSSKHSSNFSFTAAERKGNSVPSIWSTWQLWWQGALPDVSGGRLAGAKVTSWPDAGKSILVFSSKQECRQWLAEHAGDKCPFPWDPLDPADSCLMGWKGLLQSSDSEFSVWRIPGQQLQHWKAAAAAACPLPQGMWYSANGAAAAVLLATMYAAAPEKAQQLGGLHLSTVVNLRGGRCGMDIPEDSATNASVSGIRVWCPEPLLAAAAARAAAAAADAGVCAASPELMHHLRTGLQEELGNPRGTINKQFEWFEAARRAGWTSKVQLCQGLLQTDAGDVVMDSITCSAADLPTLPGTQFVASSVRMLSSYMDRIVMATALPRADGQPGHDLQIEVSFPKHKTAALYKAWRQLGFQQLLVTRTAALYKAWRQLGFQQLLVTRTAALYKAWRQLGFQQLLVTRTAALYKAWRQLGFQQLLVTRTAALYKAWRQLGFQQLLVTRTAALYKAWRQLGFQQLLVTRCIPKHDKHSSKSHAML
ncbi:hypothetical protein OEZ86_009248 [Tetradesmus obliquus]|nr:hypothetical protein OEZ86_009248 [Tetradesmus obliquus]